VGTQGGGGVGGGGGGVQGNKIKGGGGGVGFFSDRNWFVEKYETWGHEVGRGWGGTLREA